MATNLYMTGIKIQTTQIIVEVEADNGVPTE